MSVLYEDFCVPTAISYLTGWKKESAVNMLVIQKGRLGGSNRKQKGWCEGHFIPVMEKSPHLKMGPKTHAYSTPLQGMFFCCSLSHAYIVKDGKIIDNCPEDKRHFLARRGSYNLQWYREVYQYRDQDGNIHKLKDF